MMDLLDIIRPRDYITFKHYILIVSGVNVACKAYLPHPLTYRPCYLVTCNKGVSVPLEKRIFFSLMWSEVLQTSESEHKCLLLRQRLFLDIFALLVCCAA